MRESIIPSRVPEKRRFNISLPEHIAAEIERRSKNLSSSPTEFAADIIRWWFGEGSPAISEEEKRLIEKRSEKKT